MKKILLFQLLLLYSTNSLGIHYTGYDTMKVCRLLSKGKDCVESCSDRGVLSRSCLWNLNRALKESYSEVAVLDSIISILSNNGFYNEAAIYISRFPYSKLSHSELALKKANFADVLFKTKGKYFDQAVATNLEAIDLAMKSGDKDRVFISELLNRQGVMSLMGSIHNQKDGNDPTGNFLIKDLYNAFNFIYWAFRVNPQNKTAQENFNHINELINKNQIDLSANFTQCRSIYTHLFEELDNFPNDNHTPEDISTMHRETLLKEMGFGDLLDYDEIVIALDNSQSMLDESVQNKMKFDMGKEIASSIIIYLQNTDLGFITVGGDCSKIPMIKISTGQYPSTMLVDTLDYIACGGQTPTVSTLKSAKELFSLKKNKKLILLISDDLENCKSLVEACDFIKELDSLYGIDFSLTYLNEDRATERWLYAKNCVESFPNGKIYYFGEFMRPGVKDIGNGLEFNYNVMDYYLPKITIGNSLTIGQYFEIHSEEWNNNN